MTHDYFNLSTQLLRVVLFKENGTFEDDDDDASHKHFVFIIFEKHFYVH